MENTLRFCGFMYDDPKLLQNSNMKKPILCFALNTTDVGWVDEGFVNQFSFHFIAKGDLALELSRNKDFHKEMYVTVEAQLTQRKFDHGNGDVRKEYFGIVDKIISIEGIEPPPREHSSWGDDYDFGIEVLDDGTIVF